MPLALGFGTRITKPSILVRLGVGCAKTGDDFDAICLAVPDAEGYFVLQGAAGRLSWAKSIDAVRIVNQMTGFPVRWFRLGKDPYQMRQTSGLNDGKRITMKKESLEFPKHGAHQVHSGRHGGNKIDREAGVKIGADLLDQLKSGRIKVTNVTPALKEGSTLETVQDKFSSGAYVLTGVESTEVAHDGQKRAQRAKLFYHKKDSTEGRTLEIEWQLPD